MENLLTESRISRRQLLKLALASGVALSIPIEAALALDTLFTSTSSTWLEDARAFASRMIPNEPGSPGALESGAGELILLLAQDRVAPHGPSLERGFSQILPVSALSAPFHTLSEAEQVAFLEKLRAAGAGSPERLFFEALKAVSLHAWQFSQLTFDQRRYTGEYIGVLS
jgi:hypothetical protein